MDVLDGPGLPSSYASLPVLRGNIGDILHNAKDLAMVANGPQVQAFVTAGNDVGVLKRWSARRVAKEGTQLGAELRAAAVFGAVLDEPSPLMALELEQAATPKGPTLTVYAYAGPSAEYLLNTRWVRLTQQEREPLCQKLAIRSLKMIEILESVPAEFGGPKLHRDGKLSNYCYNEAGDFFVCVNFGGFCYTNLADWHGVADARYLDSYFACVTGSPGSSNSRAIQNVDEWRRHTTRSLDLYLLALAVVELYLGHLPATIDYDQSYGPRHNEEYLAAVCDYQWRDCVELADAPDGMMDFLLWCMDPNPANRPSSAAEALQHEWLFNQVPAVEQAVAEAAPAWTETNCRLREALAGCDASPAQTADPDDSSNAGSSSGGSSCSYADSDGVSSGHLWSDNGRSNGDNTRTTTTTTTTSSSSITSSEYCDDAACQQQAPAAPVDCSSASSCSNEASTCSLADCTATISPEQLKPGCSISGRGMVCSAASDTARDQVASPSHNNILADAGTLLLPPLVRSSHSCGVDEEPHALLALLRRHRDATNPQRSSDSSGAAAIADRRLQQQRYQPLRQQTSTSNVLVNINQLVLPPLMCSSHSSANVPPLSHPLECRHSRNPCRWALRHLVHSVRCVGSKFSRLVKVRARQRLTPSAVPAQTTAAT